MIWASRRGWTPWLDADKREYPEIITFLINNGANVNDENDKGKFFYSLLGRIWTYTLCFSFSYWLLPKSKNTVLLGHAVLYPFMNTSCLRFLHWSPMALLYSDVSRKGSWICLLLFLFKTLIHTFSSIKCLKRSLGA